MADAKPTEVADAGAAVVPAESAKVVPSAPRKGLNWIMVRMPKKQRKGVTRIVSMALLKFKPTDYPEISECIKLSLDKFWGGFPCWNVFIGKEFTFHISFNRGTAGVLSYGPEAEHRILLYKSAPFEKLSDAPVAAAAADDKTEDSDTAAGAAPAPAAAAAPAAPTNAKRLAMAKDDERLETDMNTELLAVAMEAIRTARREKTDPTDQADLIKKIIAKRGDLLPAYKAAVAPTKPGTAPPPPVAYAPPGLHVLIGKKYRGTHEAAPCTSLRVRIGGLNYTVFAHAIPPPKVSIAARFLEPGVIVKLLFSVFFLAYMFGWRPSFGGFSM